MGHSRRETQELVRGPREDVECQIAEEGRKKNVRFIVGIIHLITFNVFGESL